MPNNISNDLDKILYSGKLAFGEIGANFEKKLSNYLGHKNVLTVSSYNQAILIILSTLGLKPGDEVIASPVSCLASNQPFLIKELKVIWADVEPNTGSLCVESVKKNISGKTKAIFHNHYCGYLGRIKEINALGKTYGIPIIDDCIEAFGSELNGNKTGNLGTDITVFSFQTVRLPNTIDGGALVFEDDFLFEKAKKIRDYGIERSNFRDELNEINPLCDIKLEGYGALMSEINSCIGIKQMDSINSLLDSQRANAKRWEQKLSDNIDIERLKPNDSTNPNYWVFGVLAKNKIEAIKHFRSEGYYATSVHINNNIYSVFNNKIELKGVSEFMSKFFALPSGWWVSNEKI